jgi:hypothetical protein
MEDPAHGRALRIAALASAKASIDALGASAGAGEAQIFMNRSAIPGNG